METEDLQDLMAQTAENQPETGNEQVPQDGDIDDVNIPEDELSAYLLTQLKNDVADKEEHGWMGKREYDYKAYYGIKDPALQMFPWPNASAHPEPITPVLMDTAIALTDDLLWRNKERVVFVSNVGREDRRDAENLESILNWQVLNDIPDIKRESASTTFNMWFNGTTYDKIIRQVGPNGEFSLALINVLAERCYMPIDCKSPRIKDSDHFTQVIPLSANDLKERISWGQYKNLDQIKKGWSVGSSGSQESLQVLRQQVTGLDLIMKQNRDTWFMAESYETYYPKGMSSGPSGPMRALKPVEIIVWWAPSTGKICRKRMNKENLRPFQEWYVYPNHGLAYHISLPEKIRNTQEKATYTEKQVTDAADKAISPAGFYDGTGGFEPGMSLRAPTGMYKVKNIQSIQWEPVNLAPVMERSNKVKDLWLEAERITGITDFFQGVQSGETQTLGQDQMRATSAGRRFSGVTKLINQHHHGRINLIYQYDDMYMPRDTKVKVLGTQEFAQIEKLFKQEKPPATGLGLGKNFDFSIANKSIEEDERERQSRVLFADACIAHPVFGMDVANAWKSMDEKAYAMGITDTDNFIKKPVQANIITPEDIINRIMSGDKGVMPDPNMNPMEYEQRIRLFMRTGNYREAGQDIQMEMGKFLQFIIAMRMAKEQAFQKFSTDQNTAMVNQELLAQAQQAQNGNGKAPARTA